ncbi:Serine/threonine-protein kinase PknH [Anatilimnocola aggregata]|uniref:Serine/threonine-protein kinase PknH n=1 Tax=Anatilimnocola aggregata TaxID=2528021 RepID=A0A517Y8D0_9BACT|nr:serine/threonine-protein kinase [Anatilimnocola aggregata]QDU26519.1 Serine/threonine-protein kinase PknH [Anatilimnocola aggregata]
MTTTFDPYYKWLSIPPEEQPANFYRLLGLKELEGDVDVINSAADRQMMHVRSFAGGPNGVIAQRVLNELSSARVMLSDPPRKKAYDAMLKAAVSGEKAMQAEAKLSPAEEAPASKGNQFGNYEILTMISNASTGAIYKAQRRSDGLIVSLKVVPKELAKLPDFMKRMKREFELTKNIQHPHVVASYELGEVQGRSFLAFEYVGGADLGRVVNEHGPLAVPVAIETARRIADGLAHLHSKGIVHRNLKPQNVLVSVQGNLKIANLTMALEDDARAFLAGRDRNLTVMGETLGTPDYIAPEQAADSHNVDGRADLYSFGCTLHYLLTGRPPYNEKNAMAKIMAHQQSPIPSLRQSNSEIPVWLDTLFQKLLAKKPADRPASAAEVVSALSETSEATFNRTAIIAGIVAVAVLAFLIVLVTLAQR